jgi:hypothetical protein
MKIVLLMLYKRLNLGNLVVVHPQVGVMAGFYECIGGYWMKESG